MKKRFEALRPNGALYHRLQYPDAAGSLKKETRRGLVNAKWLNREIDVEECDAPHGDGSGTARYKNYQQVAHTLPQ